MNNCFLCEQSGVEMSLEHSIPQFLGGKKSDDKFKKLNLCRSCNSRLGTYVDARFARNFINAMELAKFNNSGFGHFTSIEFDENHEIHSLIPENYHIEIMVDDRMCAFWLKENTDDFLGLVGGNAPLSKSKNSQIFLFLTKEIDESEVKNLLRDIRIKFKKYNKLEILLCVDFVPDESQNSNLADYYEIVKSFFDIKGLKFSWEFDENEKRIMDAIRPGNSKNFKSVATFNLNDFVRFLSKLFLGVLCGYLGNDFLEHPVGLNLTNILKTYSQKLTLSENDINRLKINFDNNKDSCHFAENGTITISIFQIKDDIVGLLKINNISYSFKICKKDELSKDMKSILGISSADCKIPEGIMLVLKPDGEKYTEQDVRAFFLDRVFGRAFPAMPK